MLFKSLMGLIGLGLLIYDIPLGLGWFLGSICLAVLASVRERYYGKLLGEESFRARGYIAYIIFVFVILWLPLGLAFVFPKVISAYSLAASYLLDRLFLFLKGSVKHAN